MICDFPIGILFLVLPPSGFLAENSVNIWSADAYTLFMPFNMAMEISMNLRSDPNLVHIAIMRFEESFRYKESTSIHIFVAYTKIC